MFNILQHRIVKHCLLPESCFTAQKAKTIEAMNKLVTLSTKVSTSDQIHRKRVLECNAQCLSLYLRSLQHAINGDEAKLREGWELTEQVILPALENFRSKQSHLHSKFFEIIFTRVPLLCFTVIPWIGNTVLEDPKINNYKRIEFVGLLSCLVRSVNSISLFDGIAQIQRHMDVLQKVEEWARDKVENRQKEGYQDFRKLPRRKVLNGYCKLVENVKSGKKKPAEQKAAQKPDSEKKEAGSKGKVESEKKEKTIKKPKKTKVVKQCSVCCICLSQETHAFCLSFSTSVHSGRCGKLKMNLPKIGGILASLPTIKSIIFNH